MTVITFTQEKQKLIADYLKANAGGRKWHQVKAKIQDKAEAYADEIIAKNAAINAEREAAEVLRQERLALPAQRLYDGVDLTHVPVVKTESSVPSYKSIFRLTDNEADDGYVLMASFLCTLSYAAIKVHERGLTKGGKKMPDKEFEELTKIVEEALIWVFSTLRKKESVNNDNATILKIKKIYAKMEIAMLDRYNYDSVKDAYNTRRDNIAENCIETFRHLIYETIKEVKKTDAMTLTIDDDCMESITRPFIDEVNGFYGWRA